MIYGQTRRQFVTAAIVSCREIEMEDLKCIIYANNKLNILQTTNTKVKFQDYFLLSSDHKQVNVQYYVHPL
jgi:hypothetical protein